MEYISYDEFKGMDIYKDFMNKNPSLGYLKIQASAASNAVPIEGVEIIIYKDIGEFNVVFFKGVTDSSGIIDNIVLPTPKSNSFQVLNVPEYSLYEVNAKKEGFYEIYDYQVGVFDNLKNLQNLVMDPVINIEIDN